MKLEMSRNRANKQQQQILEQLRVLIKEDSSLVSNLFEEKIQEIVEERVKTIRREIEEEIFGVLCDGFGRIEDVNSMKKDIEYIYSNNRTA